MQQEFTSTKKYFQNYLILPLDVADKYCIIEAQEKREEREKERCTLTISFVAFLRFRRRRFGK
jgi:hypothetical protein